MDVLSLLKHFREYGDFGENITFTYPNSADVQLTKVKNMVNLCTYNKSDLEIAYWLMGYVFKTLIPGNEDFEEFQFKNNSIEIIESTLSRRIHSNCIMYSTVCCELFWAYGLKARPIICFPPTLNNEFGCHCMIHAYIDSMKRWLLFDPSHCAMFRTQSGIFLDLPQLRYSIINEKPYVIFGAGIFNKNVNEQLKSFLPQYMFNFYSPKYNYFNCTSGESYEVNMLLPKCIMPQITDMYSNSQIHYTCNERDFYEL